MGYVKDVHNGLQTVGEVIEALQKFPADMPVECSLCNAVKIYRDEPMEGETRDDADTGGTLTIEGDDDF